MRQLRMNYARRFRWGECVSLTSELGLRAASTGTKTVGYRVARKLTLSLASSFRPNVPRPGKLMVEQVVA